MFTRIGSFSRRLFFFSHADFADDADFSLLLFLFPTDFTDARRFLTCSVWDFADGRSFFTFLPFYLYQVYKMLLNCGFSFIKSEKLRTKMFYSAKKVSKIPPPFIFFSYFCPQKMRTIM